MSNLIKTPFFILLIFLFYSCATTGMLPEDVDKIDFNSSEGKTGWSEYKQYENFTAYTLDQVYDAIKVGLGNAGFSIISADKMKGRIVGEHGMTLHDWNVIAGVYFKEANGLVKVAVIIEGSKDFGFSGDVTGDGWAGKILKSARNHLNSKY